MREALRSCIDLCRLSWRSHPMRFVAATVLMVLEGVALPLSAPALAALTDAIIARDGERAQVAALAVAVLAVSALVAGHFAHIAYNELGELNVLSLDQELIRLANGSPGLEHHERPEYADRIQVLKQELFRVGNVSMNALLSTVGLLVAIGTTAVLLFRLNAWLLLLPLAALPPLLAGGRAESIIGRAREHAAQPTRRALHLLRLATSAAPAKEVRVYRLESEIVSRHGEAWDQASATLRKSHLVALALRALGQSIFALAYIGATLLVVRDTVAGRGSVGDVVLVIVLAAQVNQQVTGAVSLLEEIQRLARSLTGMRWVRRLVASSISQTGTRQAPDQICEGIRWRGVTFTYPGTESAPALDQLDLFLPAGSVVALVGENGAGKSTMIKLLLRFYDVTSGVIELDSTDLRHFTVDSWRERIAAGFQDFAHFEFLVRETVGVGDLPRLSDHGAVLSAVERAYATDLVEELPHGLQTQLGRTYADGVELSGGQWQKLALSRAMMRKAPLLLVLDEPTAALDAEAEHRLFERYAAAARRVSAKTGAVTILVSHRFSTTRMADLIVVVEDARATEVGSHDQLMAAGGTYAALYRLQARQYQ